MRPAPGSLPHHPGTLAQPGPLLSFPLCRAVPLQPQICPIRINGSNLWWCSVQQPGAPAHPFPRTPHSSDVDPGPKLWLGHLPLSIWDPTSSTSCSSQLGILLRPDPRPSQPRSPGAAPHPLGSGRAFQRLSSGTDICPLWPVHQEAVQRWSRVRALPPTQLCRGGQCGAGTKTPG